MSAVSLLRELLLLARDVVAIDVLPMLRPKPKAPAHPNVTKPPIDPHEAKDMPRITAKRRAMKPRQP